MGSPQFQKISCRGLMETYPWIRVLYNHQQHHQTIKWNSEASLRKMKLPRTYVILVFHGWVFMLQVVYKWFLGLITKLGLLSSKQNFGKRSTPQSRSRFVAAERGLLGEAKGLFVAHDPHVPHGDAERKHRIASSKGAAIGSMVWSCGCHGILWIKHMCICILFLEIYSLTKKLIRFQQQIP